MEELIACFREVLILRNDFKLVKGLTLNDLAKKKRLF